MNHLESLIIEHLNWQGYFVRHNIKVGKRKAGGWEMELDVVAYHPGKKHLIHIESSLDSDSWDKRKIRFKKKFEAGHKHIFKSVFPKIADDISLEQLAILVTHPKDRDSLAGAKIESVDEFLARIHHDIVERPGEDIARKNNIASKNAIPEQYPLLRTLQFSLCGYHKAPGQIAK